MIHANLNNQDLHVAGYVQSTDPGAVGTGKLWFDTSTGTGLYTIRIRNAANTGWDIAANPSAKAVFKDYRETVTAPAISSGTLTLDHSQGNVFDVALNANITTITDSNVPATGVAYSWTLRLTTSGSYAVTWPAAYRFAGGTAPTLSTTSGKRQSFACFTTDGGTSVDVVASDVF